jgi:hypothetical protein
MEVYELNGWWGSEAAEALRRINLTSCPCAKITAEKARAKGVQFTHFSYLDNKIAEETSRPQLAEPFICQSRFHNSQVDNQKMDSLAEIE